jgi:hypothetical protein
MSRFGVAGLFLISIVFAFGVPAVADEQAAVEVDPHVRKNG